MLVHASHAGALIGRGGSKIKELRESTRANIKVRNLSTSASYNKAGQSQ